MPLRVGPRLVGAIALGDRQSEGPYAEDDLDGIAMMSHYLALAIHNHSLTETLAQRVGDNLRLMATVHNFYDTTLEAFAQAIDYKHVNIHGHSLRVVDTPRESAMRWDSMRRPLPDFALRDTCTT